MRRMTQAQYAAIVNRQRQIALAKQKQQSDLSDNNISNEVIETTKQRLEKELANKKQKKGTTQMTTPIPNAVPPPPAPAPTPTPAKKESNTLLRQEVPVLSKSGFKQNVIKKDDEEKKEQTSTNALQDFINKSKNTNYDDIIKEKNNLLETYKNERDKMESKIETLTTRYELKLKKNDEMMLVLNDTIKNLTEMLNIKFKKESETVENTTVETNTDAVEKTTAETNTDVNVKLHVDGEDIKVEIKTNESDISNN